MMPIGLFGTRDLISNNISSDRIVNITALQAGTSHYRNGNPGLEANFALFEKLARQAATSEPKPDLICFPEYTISGWSYPPENVINGIAESVPGNGYWYSRYVKIAKETGVALLPGTDSAIPLITFSGG